MASTTAACTAWPSKQLAARGGADCGACLAELVNAAGIADQRRIFVPFIQADGVC
ncbi:hypothetical protein ACFDR9_003639 [Janthinobacterium sp. CG_23.3]|uniref:hypothetical protein n=1 Tax=Janthinobacterium sp. CG_23.3 TaxID=3349634 RepID=UPI0038D50FD9